jgi:hypothetical protein
MAEEGRKGKVRGTLLFVIPAQAGTQFPLAGFPLSRE